MSGTPLSEPAAASAFAATRDAFAAAVQGPPMEVPLVRCALLIAQAERPVLDVDAYEQRIDAIAEEAQNRLQVTEGDPLPRRAVPLHEFFFDELGFQGDDEHYGSLSTLLLSDVLDTRRGMPVTLALLYVEICRRAGLPADVVGLPGHVIARLGDPPQSPELSNTYGNSFESSEALALVDVFAGGRLLSTEDCRSIVHRIYGGRAALRPHTLTAITPRQTLQRIIANLQGRSLEEGNEERASRATELLLALFPWDLDGIRDRGMRHERLGRYAEAIPDLECYVRHRPAAPDTRTVAESLRTAHSHQRESEHLARPYEAEGPIPNETH